MKRCRIPPPAPANSELLSEFREDGWLFEWHEWKVTRGSGLASWVRWICNYIFGIGVPASEWDRYHHLNADRIRLCHWHEGHAYHYCEDARMQEQTNHMEQVAR